MTYKKVAIVGAGAIGLYLAWKLSRGGHRVAVFEKNSRLGQKPCSGLISERIKNFIPWEESLAENKIEGCPIHFPKKSVVLRFKPVHFAICRQKLDQHLYLLAQKAGANIFMNHPVREIPQGFDRVIGCDGALSVVRKKMGLPDPSFRLGIRGYAAEESYSSQVEVWPGKAGFFWKIPRGRKIEYGLIGSPKAARLEFKNYLSEFGLKDLSDVKAAIVPEGLVIPGSGEITLCGDAMGLCKPWSGGGVIWGLTAADILLKHFPDFEKYHREIKGFFGFRILKGKKMRDLVYFLGNNFPWVLPSKISRDNDFPSL